MKVNFTEEYSPGMKIYYVDRNPFTKSCRLYELKISKVYPEMIVAWEEKGCAYLIGVEDDDNIFLDYHTAQVFYEQATKFGEG